MSLNEKRCWKCKGTGKLCPGTCLRGEPCVHGCPRCDGSGLIFPDEERQEAAMIAAEYDANIGHELDDQGFSYHDYS